MNNGQVVATVLLSTVSLCGLWILAFWLYRDYCVEAFRQKMFGLRDTLFDEAANGLLPFDHPAYGMLRNTMNGFIQFGHRLNLMQVLLGGLIYPLNRAENARSLSFEKRWHDVTRDLSPGVRKRLDYYLNRMNYFVIAHVILSSPLVILTIVLPLLFWIAAKTSVERLMHVLHKPIDNIDSTAIALVR